MEMTKNMGKKQSLHQKKAQITQFMIIGIILLILTSLFLYLRPKVIQEELATEEERLERIPLEARPVYLFIDKCVKDVSIPGIYLLGLRGGYLQTVRETKETAAYGTISYGFKESRSLLPSLVIMETEISDYVGQALAGCVMNFSVFTAQGKTIEAGTIGVGAEILADKVIITVNYPVSIIDEKGRTALEEHHRVNVPIPLGMARDMAASIIQGLIENPDWIDVTALSISDARVNVIPIDSTTLLYAITLNPPLEQGPFVFMFAAALSPPDYPRLQLESAYTLTEDTPFSLPLQAEGEGLIIFEAYTPLFNITDNERIGFTPEIPGNYSVEIRARDSKGHYDARNVTFIINRRRE